MFLEPITRFKDEAFHDAMAEFLRGFDRAVQATDPKSLKTPWPFASYWPLAFGRAGTFSGLRARRAGQAKRTLATRYTQCSISLTILSATDSQAFPTTLGGIGRDNADSDCARCGGAHLRVSRWSVSKPRGIFTRAALLPYVVRAATAWCSAYRVDTNFWSEKNIGGRVCTWLDRTFLADPSSAEALPR